MATKLYGLDEHIKLAGRITTIREQHRLGKVRAFRANEGAVLGQRPIRHWVQIEKEFASSEGVDVSAEDFAILRSEGA